MNENITVWGNNKFHDPSFCENCEHDCRFCSNGPRLEEYRRAQAESSWEMVAPWEGIV